MQSSVLACGQHIMQTAGLEEVEEISFRSEYKLENFKTPDSFT